MSEPNISLNLREVPLRPEALLGDMPDASRDGILPARLSFGARAARFHPSLAPSEEWERLIDAAEDGTAFSHLTIACSFLPETPAQPGAFESARLGLKLRGDNSISPLAVAMHPIEQDKPSPSSGSTTLSLNLHAAVVEAGVEQRWDADKERREWVVRGFGLMQDSPSWHFRRTSRHPLTGIYRIDVLVEFKTDDRCVADVLLSAQINRRGRSRNFQAVLDAEQFSIPLN